MRRGYRNHLRSGRRWHSGCMQLDWSTREGLAAIAEHLGSRIEGWRRPVAFGLALSPASSDPLWQFDHVNAPGGSHGLAAVVLATVLRHDGSTATLDVSHAELQAAVEALGRAEACPDLEHPNLAAWRAALQSMEANPAREVVAVFVADLEDPVGSDVDGQLRSYFGEHHPHA